MKIWRRGDTQKNTHYIQDTAKVWNQVYTNFAKKNVIFYDKNEEYKKDALATTPPHTPEWEPHMTSL
jgi:hypothetical protein